MVLARSTEILFLLLVVSQFESSQNQIKSDFIVILQSVTTVAQAE